MRHYLKVIFGLFATGIIMCPAALAQHKVVPSNVNISGKINLDENYLVVISDLRTNHTKTVEVPISKAGTFNWRSDAGSTGFVKVSVIPKSRNRQLAVLFPVYISAGSKVHLNLKYTDSTYLSLLPGKLDGDNKALIQYSNFCFLKMRDLFRNGPVSADQIKSSIVPYLDKANYYISKYGVKNERVKQYLAVWAMNNYLTSLPADYHVFPKSLVSIYNQDVAVLFNETYRSVNQYLTITMEDNHEHKDAFDQMELRFKTLESLFTNKRLINQIITRNLEEFIRRYTFRSGANFEEELARYKKLAAYAQTDDQRKELINHFSNLKYTLKGSVLPDVSFEDLNGKPVKLQTFAGKYLYIDLWASWCKPCIAEIPALQNLEKDYTNGNIVFVSISLDADKNDWKKKVAELKLEGHQLELGTSAYDELMNVSGIPHFILYDPAGKLLMYKAPRPSSKDIRTLFDSLTGLRK